MSKDNLEYFVEILGNGDFEKITGSFNLWEKNKGFYLNLATLFLNDKLCGCQWDVCERTMAVKYNDDEIQDELENPLKKIPREIAEHLIRMKGKTYKDILQYLISVSENSNFAGLKYTWKSGGTKNE